MSVENGPRQIEKLIPKSKVVDFQLGQLYSRLLISTPDNKLSSFLIQKTGNRTKVLPLKEQLVDSYPDKFTFSGQNNIVHCQDDLLLTNNKLQLKQKDKINHLLTDEHLALTTSLDFISVNSVEKGTQLAQLHQYGSNISSLFWHSSLVISGDQKGNLNLWDINKQKRIHGHSVYFKPIDYISSYVDFIHTNIYYSVCGEQRKITFSDLRDHRPIKTTHNIPRQLIKTIHNQSGKIFLLSNHNISVIDVYKHFDIMGQFVPLINQPAEQFKIKYPQAETVSRQLTDCLIWDQFVVASCDNGCIQVYNSDTFECIYGYGMSEYSGICKLKKMNNTLFALDQKGILTMAHFK